MSLVADEVRIFRMLVDERPDERALRHDPQSLRPGRVQRAADEPAADSAAPQRFRHDRVGEDDAVAIPLVDRNGRPITDFQLDYALKTMRRLSARGTAVAARTVKAKSR